MNSTKILVGNSAEKGIVEYVKPIVNILDEAGVCPAGPFEDLQSGSNKTSDKTDLYSAIPSGGFA